MYMSLHGDFSIIISVLFLDFRNMADGGGPNSIQLGKSSLLDHCVYNYNYAER